MTHGEYLKQFKDIVDEMYLLTEAKNKDYAGDQDAFANFRLVEKLGAATTEQGFVVRMADKLQRISNLINKENAVADEKIEDTLKDLSIYSILFLIYLKSLTLDRAKKENV